MRAIKVTHRAVFRQPIGALNPMGCKLPGPFPVELFQRGPHWFAREIASPKPQEYKRLTKMESLSEMKRQVEESFESQSEAWQIWGDPLTPSEKLDQRPRDGSWERLLTPYDILHIGKGKFAAYEPEDRTHIINGKTITAKTRVPPTACGLNLPAKCLIDNLANVEPSCHECAEVWRREYQGK